MTRWHLVAWALALALAGCAPRPGGAYVRSFAEGERAQTAGRYEEAARAFDEAARNATRDRDRDHARYVAALTFAKAGNVREAARRLEVLASADPAREHTAEAAYRLAHLRIAHGEPERGWKELEAILFRFPSNGVAHSAVRQVAEHVEEQRGKRGAVEYLRALDARLGNTEIGPLIAYEAARRLAELGDIVAAHDAFVAIAERWPYPFGAFWDDSLFRASELDEKLGRLDHAVEHLKRMLAERETTTLVGTYQRPRYTPALLRLAYLYADRLGDRARAREALRRLYTDFKTTPMRDDAAWLEAELWRADGDTKRACEVLERLVNDFPDSRYVPCAARQCAEIERPPASKAPSECHPYLLRAGRLAKLAGPAASEP